MHANETILGFFVRRLFKVFGWLGNSAKNGQNSERATNEPLYGYP